LTGRSRAVRNQSLVVASLCFFLAAAAGVCLAVWQSRCASPGATSENVALLGTAIGAQSANSIQGVALILPPIQTDGFAAPEDYDDRSTQENASAIISANGNLDGISGRWAVPPIAHFDRDDFRFLRRHGAVLPVADENLDADADGSKTRAMAAWRLRALVAAAWITSAIISYILLLRALSLQRRRLEQAQATLMGQNARLMRAEGQVRYSAHHDDLTKLINRQKFEDLLEETVAAAGSSGQRVTVLHLNLDRFKQINDSRGHGVGDKLLIQVAARLHEGLRDSNIVARTGGDEFAIIVATAEAQTVLPDLAAHLLQQISRPFEVEDVQCSLGMSIGIASYPDQANNAGDLLRNADIALFRAKAEGRGVFRIYEEAMDLKQQNLFLLEQELRHALELNQFDLDYQPIVEAETRRIICYEALLRWRHPGRGLVPTGDFIGIAEHLGMIRAISQWVLATACRKAMHWPLAVSLSVNLSPLAFDDERLVDQLSDILRRTGIAADRLFLEVTEGVLLENNNRVLHVMNRLNELGVRFVLDDFGKGHASLAYLRQFPFDGIKIDKFFVDDIVDKHAARAVVAAVITVCAALNLTVVAEGVETEAQLATLRGLGCKFIQGYLTGRPRSADAIEPSFS